MKWIRKSRGPRNLTQHRLAHGTDYESFKSDVGLGGIQPPTGLRKSLLTEQGFICAYCMKRIPHSHIDKGVSADRMKIEHWVAQTDQQSINAKLDITYTNMLACCMGNKGREWKYETCDTRKGEESIQISPLNLNHIRTLTYAPDGSIHSKNPTFEDDITEKLNLNEDNLRKQREEIYKFINKRTKEQLDKLLTREEKNKYLDSQIAVWSALHERKFKEFCMVSITYLQSRKR